MMAGLDLPTAPLVATQDDDEAASGQLPGENDLSSAFSNQLGAIQSIETGQIMLTSSAPVEEEEKLDQFPRVEEIEGFTTQRTVMQYKKKVDRIDHGIGIAYKVPPPGSQQQKVSQIKICDIAYLYSDPIVQKVGREIQDTKLDLLNFESEYQQIKDKLLEHCVDILICKKPATVSVLQEVVAVQPKILHISCHGLDDTEDKVIYKNLKTETTHQPNSGNLCFEHHKDIGLLKMVKGRDIEAIVNTSRLDPQSAGIRLLIVSACHSAEIAEQIRMQLNIPVAVAIKKGTPIQDLACQSFANVFYNQLLLGETVIKAFENTKRILKYGDTYHHTCCCQHAHLSSCSFLQQIQKKIADVQKTKSSHQPGCPIFPKECSCVTIEHQQDCVYQKSFLAFFSKDTKRDSQHLCCCRGQDEVSHFEPEKFVLLGNKNDVDQVIFNEMMAGSLEDSTSLNPEKKLNFGSSMWVDDQNMLNSEYQGTHIFLDHKIQTETLKERNVEVYQLATTFLIQSPQHIILFQGPQHFGIEKVAKRALAYAFERNKVLVGIYINKSDCLPNQSFGKYILDKINHICQLQVRPFESNDKSYAQYIYKKLQQKKAYKNQKIVIIIKGALNKKEQGISQILKVLTTGVSTHGIIKQVIVKVILVETYEYSLFSKFDQNPNQQHDQMTKHQQFCKQNFDSGYLLLKLRAIDSDPKIYSNGRAFSDQYRGSISYFDQLFKKESITYLKALKFGRRVSNYAKIHNLQPAQMRKLPDFSIFVQPKKAIKLGGVFCNNGRLPEEKQDIQIVEGQEYSNDISEDYYIKEDGTIKKRSSSQKVWKNKKLQIMIAKMKEESEKKTDKIEICESISTEPKFLKEKFNVFEALIKKLKTLKDMTKLIEILNSIEKVKIIQSKDPQVEFKEDWIRFDGGWYLGEVKKEKHLPHEFGIFIHEESGSVYEGLRKNGLRSGKFGRYIDKHGYRYDGAWKDNYPYGHNGHAWFHNGDHYIGEFAENGQMHGKGELWISSENRLYVGEFEHGKRQNEFRVITNVVSQDLKCSWNNYFKDGHLRASEETFYPNRDYHLYFFADDTLVFDEKKIYIYWFNDKNQTLDSTEAYLSQHDLHNSRDVYEHMMLQQTSKKTFSMLESSDLNPSIKDMVAFYNHYLSLSELTDQPAKILILMYQLQIVHYPNAGFFRHIPEIKNDQLKTELTKLIDNSRIQRVPLILDRKYNSISFKIDTKMIETLYKAVKKNEKFIPEKNDVSLKYLEEINQAYNTIKQAQSTQIILKEYTTEQERSRIKLGQDLIRWLESIIQIKRNDGLKLSFEFGDNLQESLSKAINKTNYDHEEFLNQLLKQTIFENQNQEGSQQLGGYSLSEKLLTFDQIFYFLGTYIHIAGLDQALSLLTFQKPQISTSIEEETKTEEEQINLKQEELIDKYEKVLGYRFSNHFVFRECCVKSRGATQEFKALVNDAICLRAMQNQSPKEMLQMMNENFFFKDPIIWAIIALRCNFDTIVEKEEEIKIDKKGKKPEDPKKKELILEKLWDSQFSKKEYDNNRFVQFKQLYQKIKEEYTKKPPQILEELVSQFLQTLLGVVLDCSMIRLEVFIKEISNFASFIYISQLDGENSYYQQQMVQLNLIKYKNLSCQDIIYEQPCWLEHNQQLLQEIKGTQCSDDDLKLQFTKCLYRYFDEFEQKTSTSVSQYPLHSLKSAKVVNLDEINSFSRDECQAQFKKNFLVQVKFKHLNTLRAQILHSSVVNYLHFLSSELNLKHLFSDFLKHLDQTMQQVFLCPSTFSALQSRNETKITLSQQVYLLELLINNRDCCPTAESLLRKHSVNQDEAMKWVKEQVIQDKIQSSSEGSVWIQYKIHQKLAIKQAKLEQYKEGIKADQIVRENQKKIMGMIRQQQILQVIVYVQNQRYNLHQVVISENQRIFLQEIIMARSSNEPLQFYVEQLVRMQFNPMQNQMERAIHLVLIQFLQSVFHMYTLSSKLKLYHGNYKLNRIYMQGNNTGYIDQGIFEPYTKPLYFLRIYNVEQIRDIKWVKERVERHQQDRFKVKTERFRSRQDNSPLQAHYSESNAFKEKELKRIEAVQVFDAFYKIERSIKMLSDDIKEQIQQKELYKQMQQIGDRIYLSILSLGKNLSQNASLCLEFMRSLRRHNQPYYSSPYWKDFTPLIQNIIRDPQSCNKELVMIFWQDNWFRQETRVDEQVDKPSWAHLFREMCDQYHKDFDLNQFKQLSLLDFVQILNALTFSYKSLIEQKHDILNEISIWVFLFLSCLSGKSSHSQAFSADLLTQSGHSFYQGIQMGLYNLKSEKDCSDNTEAEAFILQLFDMITENKFSLDKFVKVIQDFVSFNNQPQNQDSPQASKFSIESQNTIEETFEKIRLNFDQILSMMVELSELDVGTQGMHTFWRDLGAQSGSLLRIIIGV